MSHLPVIIPTDCLFYTGLPQHGILQMFQTTTPISLARIRDDGSCRLITKRALCWGKADLHPQCAKESVKTESDFLDDVPQVKLNTHLYNIWEIKKIAYLSLFFPSFTVWDWFRYFLVDRVQEAPHFISLVHPCMHLKVSGQLLFLFACFKWDGRGHHKGRITVLHGLLAIWP